ncbi:hypothetical protein JCM31271_27840 [Halorubrum trueperi]
MDVVCGLCATGNDRNLIAHTATVALALSERRRHLAPSCVLDAHERDLVVRPLIGFSHTSTSEWDRYSCYFRHSGS